MEWAYLERGLLSRVFHHLTDADAFSFRRVCRAWRVAAGDGSAVFRPWFIVQPYGGIHHTYLQPAGRGRFRVLSVEDDDADAAVKGRIDPAIARGASRGWLAVNSGKRLLLRDPISLTEIPLPAVASACRLFDIFLSDDPLAAPGRWTLFAFFRRSDSPNSWGHELSFCRPGDDKWARVDVDDNGQAGYQVRFFRGLEFFHGRAYVLFDNYSVAVCDVDARRLVVSSVRLNGWHFDGPEWQTECLVECGGDLLFAQVARSFVSFRRSPHCLGMNSYHDTFATRVIKIELDADGSGTPVGTSGVEGIGDHALFLAPQGHAFALPASGFPGVRAGCVYHFTVDLRFGMVISDLRERAHSHSHETVRKLPLAGSWRPLSWFCPRRPILGKPSKRGR